MKTFSFFRDWRNSVMLILSSPLTSSDAARPRQYLAMSAMSLRWSSMASLTSQSSTSPSRDSSNMSKMNLSCFVGSSSLSMRLSAKMNSSKSIQPSPSTSKTASARRKLLPSSRSGKRAKSTSLSCSSEIAFFRPPFSVDCAPPSLRPIMSAKSSRRPMSCFRSMPVWMTRSPSVFVVATAFNLRFRCRCCSRTSMATAFSLPPCLRTAAATRRVSGRHPSESSETRRGASSAGPGGCRPGASRPSASCRSFSGRARSAWTRGRRRISARGRRASCTRRWPSGPRCRARCPRTSS
mmetsp:Transcript_18835/g.65377  ORF Transcript_18835/g.65377 Transcript_18835/m.65377 type:complete len:295 (+) Transcript_18835:169-1053(+)